MAKNNKYQTNIQKVDSTWQAQILRQVTSKKTKVTKEQGDFATESEAKEWADAELKTLLATLVSSNQRHGENRKKNAEVVEQRSSRRAEKTAIAKADREAKADRAEKEAGAKEANNENYDIEPEGSIDPEVDYNFDEFSEED